MNANATPPSGAWPEFRDWLFDLIERRRQTGPFFTDEDVYFFIMDCRAAFTAPGTEKAERALDGIADSGTFRLVASSLRDFLAMIQPAKQTTADKNASDPAGRAGHAADRNTIVPELHKAGDGDPSRECLAPEERFRGEPLHGQPSEPPATRSTSAPVQKPSRPLQNTPARPQAGRPFRPGEGRPHYD